MDEVYRIRKEYSNDKSLYDAMNAAAVSESSLAPKAAKFIEWLESYRRLAAVQSADRFLRILYQDAIFKDAVYSPEFLTVYDQARTYQQFSWTGLYGFLNYLTRLWDADKLSAGGFRKAESAVNAMTIHGAKGLEFPVVFVVGCGNAIKKTDKGKLGYQKGVGFASFLYHPETKVSSVSFLKTINDFARLSAEAEEEIRLLYVAMTRAKEKLYITATPSRQSEEKVMTDASVIRRNDRFSILSGKSYIDWIYAVLMQDPGGFGQIDFRYLSEPEDTAPGSSLQTPEPDPQIQTNTDPAAEKYRIVLEKAKTYAYPLSALQGIPTKAAASKLKADLLDILKGEDQKAAISERISLMRGEQPDFQGLLDAQKRPTAAQIGSATHAFLALCDLSALSPDTIEEEAARLVEQKFLSEETAKIVNQRVLKRFAASPLMEKIKSAKKVYREKQFSLFVPLSELTKDRELAAALSGQELFVQGSIDLLLVTEDGQIELYDYKTDRITEDEQNDPALLREHLKERHGNQLQFYARAVEELFGKRPDRISIFALSIGEIVNLV